MHVVALGVACATLWVTPARVEPAHTVIVLRHTTGAIASNALSGARRADGGTGITVEGLEYWAVDERKNAVLAVGTAAALRELRQIVELVDVRPKALRISARFLRTERDASGKLNTVEIGAPVVAALNNTEASISMGSDAATLTATVIARLNGDSSVTLAAQFGIGRTKNSGMYVHGTKRLRQGVASIIAWLPDPWGTDAGPSPRLGVHPETAGELAGYYLELSARAADEPR
jgi:hypothetical protein